MLVAEAAFAHAGLPFARHAVAITQDGSELDQTRSGPDFGHVSDVGFRWGRTSVLSAVGLCRRRCKGSISTALAWRTHDGPRDATCLPRTKSGDEMAVCWFDATGGRASATWWCCRTKTGSSFVAPLAAAHHGIAWQRTRSRRAAGASGHRGLWQQRRDRSACLCAAAPRRCGQLFRDVCRSAARSQPAVAVGP